MSSALLLLGTWAALFPGTIAAPNAQGPRAEGAAHGHSDVWSRHEHSHSSRARYLRGRPVYALNGTNATLPLPPSTATPVDVYPGAGGAPTLTSVAACQFDDDYTSTTTIEVTVFITESEEGLSSTDIASLSASLSAPYPINATTTRAPGYGQETQRGTGAGYPIITATGGATRQYYPGYHVSGNSTATSTSTPSGNPILNTTSSASDRYWNTTSATVTTESGYRVTLAPISNLTTTHAPKSTEDCVIDTAIEPVTTATLTIMPTDSSVPTRTVSEGDDVATGRPQPETRHCGVHGLPVGNYFIARFVENAPGVPVTLEGCYQFCNSVMDATEGCRSYRFYPERGINAPRCDLYGSPVAYALDRIEDRHVDIWFDLECGSPRDARWAGLPGLARLAELGLE